jgi:hypothetical protein
MMTNKLRKAPFAIALTPLVAFDAVILLLIAPSKGVGWISLAIVNLAYFAMVFAFRLAPNEAGSLFGLQLAHIAVWFLAIELVFTFLVLGISGLEKWLSDEGRIFVAINILLAAAFIVTYVGVLAVQRRAGAELALQNENLQFTRQAANRLELIRSACSDMKIRTELRKVDDAIRYSPTAWDYQAKPIEEQILAKLALVQERLRGNDTSSAIGTLAEIKGLADERSALLRIAK